ncbi:MAG: hypothetical protein ABFS46_00905 [Myxococcota bacterium]
MRVSEHTNRVRRIDPGAASALLCVALLLLLHTAGCSAIRAPAPWLAPPLPPASRGGVTGEIVIPEPAAAMSEPVVVYLEPLDVESEASPADHTSTVRQLRGALHPSFLAVARGDAVRFLNEDDVYQQLFSASKPNDFDTGLLRRGESSVVRMQQPGVVRLYSTLDETASGVIYVSPSRYFAVVYPPGRFEIQDVPAGLYQLHTWLESGASMSRELCVTPGASKSLEIRVEATGNIP